MNREIKFRQRIKWLSFIKGFTPEKDYWHYWGYIDGRFIIPAKDYKSYQYTGLKDKHGKEIYEGDIVEFKEFQYEVFYSNASFKTRPCPYPINELHRQDGIIYYGCEVIGNVYENPKLIK